VSPKLPRVTSDDVLHASGRDGWRIVRQRGGHAQLKHPTKPGRVTVSRHAGEMVRLRTLDHILEQVGLSVEEFIALL